jgi:hypothetical protein
VFTAANRAEVIALAYALPAESGVPLSKWSCPELARELASTVTLHSASAVSPCSARRRCSGVNRHSFSRPVGTGKSAGS